MGARRAWPVHGFIIFVVEFFMGKLVPKRSDKKYRDYFLTSYIARRIIRGGGYGFIVGTGAAEL